MRERTKGRLADVAFDIRTVIGALFAVYGVVCLVYGLVSFTAADSAKTGGVNLNLWTGIGMLVIAALFLGWVRARPLHPDDAAGAGTAGEGDGGAAGAGAAGGAEGVTETDEVRAEQGGRR